jgi:hypothetical protein
LRATAGALPAFAALLITLTGISEGEINSAEEQRKTANKGLISAVSTVVVAISDGMMMNHWLRGRTEQNRATQRKPQSNPYFLLRRFFLTPPREIPLETCSR